MRSKFSKSAPVIAALALALVAIPNALAQCMLSKKLVKPASWNSSNLAGQRVMQAALHGSDDEDGSPSIAGMWHAVFKVQPFNGGPPNGVIDDAIVVWHKDGTEIMNSSRPAQDGNFCLGVWAKTGKLKYFLNHIPWYGNDLTNAPYGIGNPQAGAQLLEQVTLSRDGKSYAGTFTLTPYDANKQPGTPFTGVVTATRITTGTSITELF